VATADRLREEFVRLLTEDSETNDRRRKEYNQALFDPETGREIWTSLNLDMIMHTFDRAVKNVAPRR
jgi:hypothetical protein